jgi:hypothetical protein
MIYKDNQDKNKAEVNIRLDSLLISLPKGIKKRLAGSQG